jgi:peptide/nickel transport system substrate-binding protein
MLSHRLLQRTVVVLVPLLCLCIRALPAPAAEVTTKPPIANAVIDPDRSRPPAGKLTIAVHVSLSPKWLNPQETPATMAYELLWKLHDNVIKAMHGNIYTYSLAEFYDMRPDFKMATVRLRPGLKFHNGEPITAEDVKFSYENYHGMNAAYLQQKTERVDVVDERTVQFHFKEPFLDFLQYYGTTASSAGMIIPKKYYLSLGSTTVERDEKFAQAPIGAGPYKLTRQEPGIEVEFTAFAEYWRKVPSVKTVVSRGVRELPVRVAALKSGEADFAYFITGELLQSVIKDPKLRYHPNNSAPFWLMFPDMDDPRSPFHDIRVRKAVSFALDRQYLAEQETAGMGIPWGNFIPPEWPGAVQRPADEFHLQEAKRLMAEAGYANGFRIDWFTPFPAAESLSLRIMEQLRAIGISSEMNVMERPIFYQKLLEGKPKEGYGHKGFPGRQIVMGISVIAGDASVYIDNWLRCGGSYSFVCDKQIDALWERYLASHNMQERSDLITQAQTIALEAYYFVPIYINSFTLGIGPRIGGKPADYIRTPQVVLPGPPEDFTLQSAR